MERMTDWDCQIPLPLLACFLEYCFIFWDDTVAIFFLILAMSATSYILSILWTPWVH